MPALTDVLIHVEEAVVVLVGYFQRLLHTTATTTNE